MLAHPLFTHLLEGQGQLWKRDHHHLNIGPTPCVCWDKVSGSAAVYCQVMLSGYTQQPYVAMVTYNIPPALPN